MRPVKPSMTNQNSIIETSPRASPRKRGVVFFTASPPLYRPISTLKSQPRKMDVQNIFTLPKARCAMCVRWFHPLQAELCRIELIACGNLGQCWIDSSAGPSTTFLNVRHRVQSNSSMGQRKTIRNVELLFEGDHD